MDKKPEIKVQNLEQPNVQELLNRFKKRHEMNVVDVAEIISKLITTLKVDHEEGKHKNYSISVGHLGEVLGIGKGVISQFMSVWNMPQESKNFLRNYSLSLINAYQASRERGRDEFETIKAQKKFIVEKSSTLSSEGSGKRIDILLHSINSSQMILKSVCSSHKIPNNLLEIIKEGEENTYDGLVKRAKLFISNIDKCINYLSPKISKLSYLKKELEFCNLMLENNISEFCGNTITVDCLNKQIKFISDEIVSVEVEQKLPHIASLLMMKSEIEKNI
jgi:hypothetical protein